MAQVGPFLQALGPRAAVVAAVLHGGRKALRVTGCAGATSFELALKAVRGSRKVKAAISCGTCPALPGWGCCSQHLVMAHSYSRCLQGLWAQGCKQVQSCNHMGPGGLELLPPSPASEPGEDACMACLGMLGPATSKVALEAARGSRKVKGLSACSSTAQSSALALLRRQGPLTSPA